MEDLAYLYLASNEEVTRTQRGSTPAPVPTAWAPPVHAATLHPTTRDRAQEATTVQAPDMDFDGIAYPSFYL